MLRGDILEPFQFLSHLQTFTLFYFYSIKALITNKATRYLGSVFSHSHTLQSCVTLFFFFSADQLRAWLVILTTNDITRGATLVSVPNNSLSSSASH